jgi:hypothetical protein
MSGVREPELDRQGRRLGRAGGRSTAVGAALALPGLVLVIVGLATGTTVVWAVGLAAIAILGGPAVVGGGLLLASAVSRWRARHRSFA